jgi:hypothetical protein
MPRSYGLKVIRPEMTVRQIAVDFPASQDVFRRHGEQDAPPARFGHMEPLTHFARRQRIPLEELLAELAAAVGVPIERRGRFAERVHHGFILSASVLTLTLGAGWGAWLLWQIGMQGQFEGVPAAHVIAHGEAQLWGFIVLFVMGVSLRTVLQGAAQYRWGTWVCRGLLSLALLGVGGSMLWSLAPMYFPWLGLLSSAALCLVSLVLSTLQILLVGMKWRATPNRAVILSGLWLIAWAVVTGWLRWNSGDAGPGSYSDAQRLLLIELAVFGFAMNSIYGFGQILLPGLLRIGSTRKWAIELALWLHNAGALSACLAAGQVVSGLGMVIGSAFLVSGAALFAVGLRGFVGRRRTSHGDEKGHAPLDYYPPLAFFWLLAALVLLTGGALYEAAADVAPPDAYVGEIRHALTVGFMTTLILGVGQRLLPVVDRTVLAMPRLAIPILVLIGVGNFLRVGSELAVLATPSAFRVMPISSMLEWSALLLFAISMIATMFHRDPVLKWGRVTRRSSLAVLLAEHPGIEDRLRCGGTEYLRRTRSVPEELTVGSFAESEGYDPAELVARINSWLTEAPADH